MFKNRYRSVVCILIIGLLTILVLAGCGPQEEDIKILDQPSCEDIVFESDDEPVNAILCFPAGPQVDLPTVVYLYGAGAFETPPPEIVPDINAAMPYNIHSKLAEHGFAALSILYFSRTPSPPEAFPPNTFIGVSDQAFMDATPIWIETIEDGFSYMQSRPEVDPDRVGLAGYSLGGMLALGLDQDITNHAALISISGFFGSGSENLAAGNSPTLILQAEADEWVDMGAALAIKDVLETNGIEHELVVIPGADHRWIDQPGEDGFDAIVEFLESHLSPSEP